MTSVVTEKDALRRKCATEFLVTVLLTTAIESELNPTTRDVMRFELQVRANFQKGVLPAC